MKKIYPFIIITVLIFIISACSFGNISTTRDENPKQETKDTNKIEKLSSEVPASLQSIPQEKIAFCLFEVDTWNIPEKDLISKPKPYSAYFFDSNNKVLYLLHEKDHLKKDDKMLCAFRCNEAKPVYKSEDSILTIEQEFGGQINNELYYARIPDLDKISLELLENESLKVKYSNREKIINKNDSLNDELLLIIDDKEYKIKITIKNFGLIDKTQIKTRHLSSTEPTETAVDNTHTVSTPSPTQSGKTETFNYGGLKLEVTNVREIKSERQTDDMGKPWEYKVFVCYPGARATVLDADMSNPELNADGKSHAEWAIMSASGERTDIVDGMQPFDVSSNVLYIYDPESSMAVLKFEVCENDKWGEKCVLL